MDKVDARGPVERARFSRPRLPTDLVPRRACRAILDAGDDAPLILISAPAGYGKSTLIVEWLAGRPEASAWLSLDETDVGLQRVLLYIAEAVRSAIPGSMEGVLALSLSGIEPTHEVAATYLSNDLGELPEPFTLVLDDFHRARSNVLTELIARLLKHPPPGIRLVISTRRDPSLPLTTLRAQGKVTELRMRELQFSEEEAEALLTGTTRTAPEAREFRHLHEVTEGWAVALRLAGAVLSRRTGESRRAFLEAFDGATGDIKGYLLNEVLADADPLTNAFLDASAIAGLFSAPLLDHLVSGSPFEGRATEFIDSLDRSGLPVVHLDDEGTWVRYHHLIEDLLRWRIDQRSDASKARGLHLRAAAWFEGEGMTARSLEHLLAAEADAEVVALFDRERGPIMDGERWAELNAALRRLPHGVGDRSPGLLLLKAFALDHQLRLGDAWPLVDRAEQLLNEVSEPHPGDDALRGEIDCLRGVQLALAGRLPEALDHAERALVRLPREARSQRGHAMSDVTTYLQMLGRVEEGRRRIREFAADEGSVGGTLAGRIRFADAYLEWMEGDMPRLEAAAHAGIEIADRYGLPEAAAGFRYFLGLSKYQVDDLDAAAAALETGLNDRVLATSPVSYVQGGLALASTHLGLGDIDRAREITERVYSASVCVGSVQSQVHAEAFLAHLDLWAGDTEGAVAWASHADIDLLSSFHLFYAPAVSQALIGATEGSPESLSRAENIALQLHELASTYHNRIRGVGALCLNALIADRRGQDTLAIDHFRNAVDLARPGRILRVFADLLPALVPTLDHVYAGARIDPFSEEVLTAIRRASDARHRMDQKYSNRRDPSEGIDTLSRRQMDVLELLQARLSNREIARRLFISPGTVKRHTEDIYQKLGVHDRRSAVERASALGLLSEPNV